MLLDLRWEHVVDSFGAIVLWINNLQRRDIERDVISRHLCHTSGGYSRVDSFDASRLIGQQGSVT